jgi:hypothetical protein
LNDQSAESSTPARNAEIMDSGMKFVLRSGNSYSWLFCWWIISCMCVTCELKFGYGRWRWQIIPQTFETLNCCFSWGGKVGRWVKVWLYVQGLPTLFLAISPIISASSGCQATPFYKSI